MGVTCRSTLKLCVGGCNCESNRTFNPASLPSVSQITFMGWLCIVSGPTVRITGFSSGGGSREASL